MLHKLVSEYPLPIVRSLGRSVMDPVWRERAHRGNFTELLHVVRGRVNFEMLDAKQRIAGRAGDSIYAPARALHRDDFSPDAPFEVYIVQFEWEGEAEFLGRYSPAQLAAIPEAGRQRVSVAFHEMYQTFRRSGLYGPELTSLQLLQIILTLAHEVEARRGAPEGEAVNRQAQIMGKAREVIDARYHEPLSLDEIAAAVHVSPYHLSHVFSAESGFTLSQYLTDVRMRHAAKQLRTTNRPVKAVALSVGFSDARYFGRVFRQHFGQPPSQFRQQ